MSPFHACGSRRGVSVTRWQRGRAETWTRVAENAGACGRLEAWISGG